jgi:cell division protease FtsH
MDKEVGCEKVDIQRVANQLSQMPRITLRTRPRTLLATLAVLAVGGGSLCGPAGASAAVQAPTAASHPVTLTGELTAVQHFTSINGSTVAWTLRVGETRYPVDLTHTVISGAGPALVASQSYPTTGASALNRELAGAVVKITGTLGAGHLLAAHLTHIVESAQARELAGSSEGFLERIGHFIRTYGPIAFQVLLAVAIFFIIFMMRGSMPRVGSSRIKPTAVGEVSWEDIAGCDEAKAELREVTEFFSHPERFAATGARVPRGFLLTGPPGTGKTLLAKALARQTGARFYYLSASSLNEIYVGVGPKKLRRIFAAARKHPPAIIFLDEIDAAGKPRGSDFHGEDDKTLNQLLTEMDGFTEHDQVVVIGATNRPEALDSALLRPGRFDRRLFVAVPDRAGREQILTVHTRNKPLRADVSLARIAATTSGLSGADLANLCNEAAIFAARAERSEITASDFSQAFDRVAVGHETRKVVGVEEKRILAYHEAGHATAAIVLPNYPPPAKITIVSHGGALGFTLHIPDEDRYLQSKEDLIAALQVRLAGRAAESMVIGSVCTGATDDLERATVLTREMVDRYGMGRQLLTATTEQPLSETFRYQREQEQAKLLEDNLQAVWALLAEHRPLLDLIAGRLLEDETLEREDIEQLIASYREGASPTEALTV